MAKHGGKKHLKISNVPKMIRIGKKRKVWMVKPLPGRHDAESSVALLFILKIAGFANSAKEVKKILNSRAVKVDGKIITEEKYPVGLMDVIEVGSKALRLVLDESGRLKLIETKNPRIKICLVKRKRRAKEGRIFVALHDGTNLLDYNCSVNDSIKISLPERKPIALYKLEKGAKCLITKGKYAGKIVDIKEVTEGNAAVRAEVTFEIDGVPHRTLKEYAFPINEADL